MISQQARAQGDDIEALRQSARGLIQELERKGAIGKDNADAMMREVGPAGAASPAPSSQAAGKATSLSDLPEKARNEIKEELRRELMAGALEATQTTINLIQALVQSGIISREKADELIREAKRTAAEAAAAQNSGSRVVRVPYVPFTVRNEMKDELRKDVMAQAKAEGWAAPSTLPRWLEGTTWGMDVRLRFQQDRYAPDNFTPLELSLVEDPINPDNLKGNSQNTNTRSRVRLRFGAETRLSEMTALGFRLATGDPTNPVSTNQTLGNNLNRYAIGVDLAYIKLDPAPWLNFAYGRIANPFFHTDLVWQRDLGFDGVATTVRPTFSESGSGFLILGAFPIAHIDPNSGVGTATAAKGKGLYAAQTGFVWGTPQSTLKAGVALYDYRNTEGIPNSGDAATSNTTSLFNLTAPAFRQKGNSIFDINQNVTNSSGGALPAPLFGLAAKFRELNLTVSLDLAHLDPYHVVFTGDYVKNIGFDRSEILQRTGRDIEPKTMGYQVGVLVGTPTISKRDEWNAFASYKYLERDAVLDAYTDADFRLGGTDAKGYVIGGNFGIDKNTWLTVRWLSANPISGPPLSIDVFQLDLNARF